MDGWMDGLKLSVKHLTAWRCWRSSVTFLAKVNSPLYREATIYFPAGFLIEFFGDFLCIQAAFVENIDTIWGKCCYYFWTGDQEMKPPFLCSSQLSEVMLEKWPDQTQQYKWNGHTWVYLTVIRHTDLILFYVFISDKEDRFYRQKRFVSLWKGIKHTGEQWKKWYQNSYSSSILQYC